MKSEIKILYRCLLSVLIILSFAFPLAAQNARVDINWNKTVTVSHTTPTLQVVVNPMLRRGSPIHEGTFTALKALGATVVRFVPWFPYPHDAVAELRPPAKDSTFWDFSHVDPIMEDFMKATSGHSVIINFSTIPNWMFQTEKPAVYDSNPDSVCWSYNQGKNLRDTTLAELTGYYSRLFSWYTKGGFNDELGKYHRSGYHYKIQYWEVLNEPDLEHAFSPEEYTRIYDAIVTALRKISPQTKFVGLALAFETNHRWFEYFLNHANHRQGIKPEAISYHFYGTPESGGHTIDKYQYSFFTQADSFLSRVRYVESVRKKLSPKTFTTIDEIGNILGDQQGRNIPDGYWNLSGAMYAYLYVELTKIGIDVAGESQLVGYPTQFPSVSMMDWKNGRPNARYWVLKLLKDNFGAGDQLVNTEISAPDIAAQAFITNKGKKLLLINKRDTRKQVVLPAGMPVSSITSVDITTGENPPSPRSFRGDAITLEPFSVTVVNLKK